MQCIMRHATRHGMFLRLELILWLPLQCCGLMCGKKGVRLIGLLMKGRRVLKLQLLKLLWWQG